MTLSLMDVCEVHYQQINSSTESDNNTQVSRKCQHQETLNLLLSSQLCGNPVSLVDNPVSLVDNPVSLVDNTVSLVDNPVTLTLSNSASGHSVVFVTIFHSDIVKLQYNLLNIQRVFLQKKHMLVTQKHLSEHCLTFVPSWCRRITSSSCRDPTKTWSVTVKLLFLLLVTFIYILHLLPQ